MPDFIPRRDAQVREWSSNFARKLLLSYESYSLTLEQAQEYALLDEQFSQALRIASEPGTRTAVTIRGKDDVRKRLLERARALAGYIRARPGVNDAARIGLGLKPDNRSRARIPAPVTFPQVMILDVKGTRVKLSLRDSASNFRKAKPKGVEYATIMTWLGEAPPADSKQWVLTRMTGHTLCTMDMHASAPPGTKLWIVARWETARGLTGPWSSPVFTHLLDGLSSPQQSLCAAA